jgi:WD40 repeat protein
MNFRRFAVLTVVFVLSLPVFGQEEAFLPDDLTPITAENAGGLSLLARIGRGLVYDIKWAEDGESLFVSASTGVWEYPAGEDASIPDTPLLAHDPAFFPGILSANGQYLAQRNASGNVRVVDLNGETVTEFETNAPYLRMVFSGDGKTLAAVSSDGTATVVRLPSGETVGTLTVPANASAAALNHDGSVLASTERKQTEDFDSYDVIRLYDVTTGAEIRSFEDESIFIVATITFTPDGTRMIASAMNGVYQWNLENGELLRKYENPAPAAEGTEPTQVNETVALSPDGSQVAVIGTDLGRDGEMAGTVYVWDAESGEEIAVLDDLASWSSLLAYSPNGSQLAYYAYDGAIRLWDTDAESDPRVLVEDHYGANDTIAIHPDGSTVAAGGFDRGVRWYSLEDGRQTAAEYVHVGDVTEVVYSADGNMLSTASQWSNNLWRDGEETALDILRGGDMLALAFSPDDSMVYGASTLSTSLYTWQAPTDGGDVTRGDLTLTEVVTAGAFNADVSLLALGGGSGRITLYDPVTLEEQAVLEQTGGVTALEFSPDGALLLAAYADGKTVLWDVASGEEIDSVQADAGVVNGFAFNPDASLLATANSEGTVSVWDFEARERLGSYEAHLDDVLSVAFSPDGTLLLAGSWDGTISVWGVE